jgi:Fe2+-dicitrate sensor, membrane component
MATSSENEKNRGLIAKYLEGSCTPEERALVEYWYNSFDDEPLLKSSNEKSSLNRVESALADVLGYPNKRQRIIAQLTPYLRVASVILIFLTASIFAINKFKKSTHVGKTYFANNGEVRSVTLPDGTQVSLNGGSRLEITSDFEKGNREVKLTGEAYFKVVKDPKHPFLVNTSTIITRVLGTEFNVQAYDNENQLTVTVAEGKVGVKRQQNQGGKETLSRGLLPGQQLTFNKTNKRSTISQVDASRTSAWRNGIVYFEDASIPEIARKLERKYNLHIKVTGPDFVDCRYTLRFSSETRSKAIEVLSKVSGADFKFTDSLNLTINTTSCR